MASTPPTTTAKRLTYSPACDVVTNAVLLRHITAFQTGVPVALYAFWIEHDANGPRAAVHNQRLRELIDLVVTKGFVPLFALLRHVRLRLNKSEWVGDWYNQRAGVAIKHNRVDMVEWALSNATRIDTMHYQDRRWWADAIEAYRPNDFRVLELIRTHFSIGDAVLRCSDCFFALSHNPEIHLLQWIDANWPAAYAEDVSGANPGRDYTWAKLLSSAIGVGDVTAVRFLLDRISPSRIDEGAFHCALRCEKPDILELLIEHCFEHLEQILDCPEGLRFQRLLATCSDPSVVALLWKYASIFRHGVAYLVANKASEDLPLVKKWYAAGKLAQSAPVSIDTIADYRRTGREAIEAISFLQTIGLATATTDAMDEAARQAKWDVVDYLHTHRTEGCTSKAMDAAVRAGNLERVRFFHEHYGVDCTWEGTTNAAEYQRIAIVRYLHEHTTSPFTTHAMDEAAYEGRLHVVKFLHEHRSEGCTRQAVDKAARRGNLDVVTFLLENRQEGFSPKVIKKVLREGHVKVLNALYRHSPSLFGPDLLRELLVRGAFDIYMQLRDRYPDEANAVVEEAMEEAGKKLELPTIRFILDVLDRKDLANLAVDGAAWYRDMDWVRAVLKVTGLESCRLSAVKKAIGSRHERRHTFEKYNYTISFLISVCNDPREMAIELGQAKEDADNLHWLKVLKRNKAVEMVPINPLLLDPRTRSWAIRDVVRDDEDNDEGVFAHYKTGTWAIRAIHRRDRELLEVLRGLKSSTVKEFCDANVIGRSVEYPSSFSFEGAREAAIRMGDMETLKWLLENITFPIEPTLLSEALYHNQYAIAEWLVEAYPNACTKFDWTEKGNEKATYDFGLRDGLLDWLETHDAVRNLVPIADLIGFAARENDVASLRQLYARYPAHFVPRPSLVQLARKDDCCDALQFFSAIGYDLKAVHQAAQVQKRNWTAHEHDSFFSRGCGEKLACEIALAKAASSTGNVESWSDVLDKTLAGSPYLKHPLLADPRGRAWILNIISSVDPHASLRGVVRGQSTWAIRAVLARDVSLLELIRDLPQASIKSYLESVTHTTWFHPLTAFSFEGARAVAVRTGDLTVLEWLLTNVDLPTEPTLLADAIHYHQYDVAEWLITHAPAACAKLEWMQKATDVTPHNTGDIVDFLTHHKGAREAASFVTDVIDFVARKNDVASLEQLYEWTPELFAPRPSLIELADLEECSDTINFLLEIGWSPDVFFEGEWSESEAP